MTLVELLAALSLTGLAMALAAGVSRSALDESERIVSRTQSVEDSLLREGLLRELLRQHAPATSTEWFLGSRRHARFVSRCPVAAGDAVACTVTLRIDGVDDSRSRLTAWWEGAAGFTFRHLDAGAHFVYLDDGANGAGWLGEWGANIRPARAIGVVNGRDTSVYWIGIP